MKDNPRIFYLLIFILALAVNFAGINVHFFTDDPGLYASIAKNLVYKKQFFELFTYNRDWLDKPHFPFWMVYFSFKLFGISEWAYRLPALLFFLMSLVYTWLFTKKFYGWETAAIAVLILATALNTILGNTDLRAEPYLMGLIIGSIYHIAGLQQRYKFKHLLLAALFTAFAIMTKGIFVITAIYGALLGQLILQKKFKTIFQFKWLLLFVLTFIFTLPEFYALYIQFDLHPEKVVFDRQQVSGIRWFLWDSQFGRFVNNGPINRKTSGSIFFYGHTLLWAFAPWGLLFFYAVFKKIKSVYKKEVLPEYYAISGGVLLLLLFSLSRFQLPFYTNAIFPLFAIVTAPLCLGELSKFGTKFRLIVQWVFIILLPVAVIVLNTLLKPQNNFFILTGILLGGLMAALVIIKIKETYSKVFLLSCIAVLFAGFYVNTTFYNEIVPYKGQIAAAGFANQQQYSGDPLYVLNAENNLYQFYCNRQVDLVPAEDFGKYPFPANALIYVNQQSMDQLVHTHAKFTIVRAFTDYPKENILPAFINANTRSTVLEKVYLIRK
ncbi:ArnT family glycosyltransferase [Mucilaginibacter gotjawali]|uniref:4-amino-4-deoxy-L-arabinose transferase-like glycosyltransferase n=2 Tax=Mucilaginibacter gotjawali TaxID=1550579 RepID=A0A839SIX8_9SPHI|nr:glycosyltransferase family 39 protein [Mucilaginibacter gotjawali]MBB3057796.1 4-amino-4-deoxy-L-arabinose transferase-like glycosyltransferase [Mucilaginibacter gotjawali]BAU52598.1 Undecaprenyl phosphate-alpha-4-amino-4-deoxy-L-arabinose arabinosyl transferase [Mucilaginibacter gotjawali]